MKYALALSFLAFAGAASATYCPDGSRIEDHPGNNCRTPINQTPVGGPVSSESSALGLGVGVGMASSQSAAGAVSGSSANATGGAGGSAQSFSAGGSSISAQRQAQEQAQRMSSTNSNANTTGNNTNTAGGAQVTIQGAQAGSGDSYTDRSMAVAWAPIIPAPAAPGLATANMVMVPGVCGPRHGFIRRDVQGRKFNSVKDDESFAVGTNDTLFAEDEPFIQKGKYLVGSLVTEIHAVPGTSAAGGISLGAFSKGDGVQGGLNGSGATQQVTTRYSIKDCVYAVAVPVAAAAPMVAPAVRAMRQDRN